MNYLRRLPFLYLNLCFFATESSHFCFFIVMVLRFSHYSITTQHYIAGVTMEDIADELREAYAANKEVLDNFKEEYTMKDNPLFLDFVDELMFVKRNVARVVPASQEQFSRLLIKLFKLANLDFLENFKLFICY